MQPKLVPLPVRDEEPEEVPVKPQGNRILLPLSFTLMGLLVALLLIEGAFRLLYRPARPWNDRPAAYVVPDRATTLTDRPYAPVKPKGTIRIAVVGDSFSFGPYLQYDDTFIKRMERWLNLNSTKTRVEVINYGVPRYSTSHEVSVVKRALSEGADLVILQITLNDPEIKPYRPNGILDRKTGQPKFSTGIYHYWKSLAFVRMRIENWRSQSRYVNYFFHLFNGKKNWQNFVQPMRKIVELVRREQIPLIAVVFPLFGHPVDKKYPFFELHEKVGQLLWSLQVPSLDLAEAYRGLPLARLQVIPEVDRHPNEIAHRIAAEAIMRWLPELKLLPPELFPKTVPDRIGIELPGNT